MSAPPKGLVVIHGHFYQPPRENPWTGQVDAEPNAAPDHDWNVRITREAYAPLIPVYEQLSFDFGPTLLDWMEREAGAVYRAVLRSDHGNALASPYHHIILPLAGRRDKETEVRWGIDDFKRRFGRMPTGFWLPETAVDMETLEVLAGAGIQFTVLAPHQVSQPPENGLPARIALPHGRSIAVFVYDGSLSHGVAFGGLTTDANRFSAALEQTPPGVLASIAVDGETFGHHHKGGDKTLATVLQRLRQSDKVVVTDFATVLGALPPAITVDLVEPTSWSCPHGVERWRRECGCRIHTDRPSQQKWRTGLRFAVEWLAHEVHEIYGREGRNLMGGPRAFLEAAGATGPVPGDANTARLIEMERGVLRAMTSCGWFFDDIAGLEGRQVLRYAAHAISLAGAESARLEAGFIEQLDDARSNDPAAGSAVDVFRSTFQQAPS
jgi:alpha-amylase/alpha-mannosidase (GH57 family)